MKLAKRHILTTLFLTLFLTACSGGLADLAEKILYPFDNVNKNYQVPENPPENLYQVTFNVPATDGSTMSIHSWVYNTQNLNARTFVYFHGNGENLQALYQYNFIGVLKQLGVHFIIIDYPGLGRSQGVPNQENLVNSALAAIDWAKEKHPGSTLIVWGRSLGAAVATLATSRRSDIVDGLIITSGWNNFLAVAKDKTSLANSIPKSWTEQNRYDSAAAAAMINLPVLIHHGVNDKTIPIKFGRTLFHSFPAEVNPTMKEIAGKDHNDIFTVQSVWQDIKSFMN
ncbi:MAG: hypothetical protein A2Z20_12965 [Bdellovibrionales bacterium RBG_16_40_8]|nr:MAG: hypothetical protein A2Z20_12965 [Bdellovibrionales bacterium RBG_16_40_8]